MASRGLVKPVEVQGLRDLQRALKQADGESQKQLRVVLNGAAETVIGGARRRVPSKSGAARASLKARSSQREAIVVGGGRKAEYFGFLEFGNKVRAGHGVGRGDSVPRKFVEGGRYIYPSWAANRKSILNALADSIADVARQAGLEVT